MTSVSTVNATFKYGATMKDGSRSTKSKDFNNLPLDEEINGGHFLPSSLITESAYNPNKTASRTIAAVDNPILEFTTANVSYKDQEGTDHQITYVPVTSGDTTAIEMIDRFLKPRYPALITYGLATYQPEEWDAAVQQTIRSKSRPSGGSRASAIIQSGGGRRRDRAPAYY